MRRSWRRWLEVETRPPAYRERLVRLLLPYRTYLCPKDITQRRQNRVPCTSLGPRRGKHNQSLLADGGGAPADVRVGSKAEVGPWADNVRFAPETGHQSHAPHVCFGPEADHAPQNYLLTLFAASTITANTSFGLESIVMLLLFRVVVFALALFAIFISSSGLIAWSSEAITYHEGLVFHAALTPPSPNTLFEQGC